LFYGLDEVEVSGRFSRPGGQRDDVAWEVTPDPVLASKGV